MKNKADFEAVSAEFERMFQELFVKGPGATYKEFTYEKPISGTSFDYGFLSSAPVAEEWVGNAGKQTLRMNKLSFPAKPYQVSIEVPIEMYHGDKEGLLADYLEKRILDLKTGNKGTDKIMFDTLLAGLVSDSEDGTTHFATDHPGPAGSTQSNMSTGSVTMEEIRTAIETMAGYVDRDTGAPLGVNPTHIMHGPSTRFAVQEAIAAPLLTSSAGTNVSAGALTPVENKWLTGDYANCVFILDGSDPIDRALGLGVAKDWEPIAKFDNEIPYYIFRASAVLAPARGHWTKSYVIKPSS